MINISKIKLAIVILCVFIGGAASFFGFTKIQYLTGSGYTSVPNDEYKEMIELSEQYYKLDTFIEEISTYYYKDVDMDQLFEHLYRSLFDFLDDEYSMYLDKEEMDLINQEHDGSYSGVGVVISYNEDGECEVLSVIGDSPAEKAGVKSGDVIVNVDGEAFDSIEGFSSALRGTEGTEVKAEIKRGNSDLTFTMKRAMLDDQAVTGQILDDNIGYIIIDTFNELTANQFEEELTKMEDAQVLGVIIDLRYNGGGLVDSAVDIADMLMHEGTVVYTEDKYGTKEYYETEDGRTYLPVVVLANEYTASSSEILIAGLKDQGTPVIGETTYGKGIIQIVSSTYDGDGFSLTINQFFTPSGEEIHGKGIKPDYKVEFDENSTYDNQLDKAIDVVKGL